MSKRFVVVGGATAMAGLVLGASIVLGPDAIKSSGTDVGNVTAPSLDNVGDSDAPPGARVSDFVYTTFEVDSDGQLRGMRLKAAATKIKPLGITELEKPNAEIRLGSQRAITITADKADMLMEDRKPREGQFMGNVIVTLFQAPEGSKLIIDEDDPAHEAFVQQRIYLDDPSDPDEAIYFSIEDDTITTAGPVHATSAQVDFFGLGLHLSYNTQRRRIERLTINEGRYLIYNPDAQAPGFRDEVKPNKSDTDAESKEASGTEQQTPPPPSQFYAVDFYDNVIIRDGKESELGGDRLSIDFSLGTEAITPERITPPTTNPNDNDDAASTDLPSTVIESFIQLAQATENEAPGFAQQHRGATELSSTLPPDLLTKIADTPALTIPPTNAARSLFTHKPDRDIVVTWTGQMQIDPHDLKPEVLADEDDVRVTLSGQNAYAQTTRNGELERVETGRLEHLASKQRTVAFAKPDSPARIVSEALGGEIFGQRITLNQETATASVLGPGKLTYTNKDDDKTLTLTWQNRLDLELYTEDPTTPTSTLAINADDEQPEASGTPIQKPDKNDHKILGVKTATFDGTVKALHPDFDLAASKLTIAFTEPNKKLDINNTPNAINASGNVVVLAKGDADDEDFNIKAQRLSIALKLDTDGEPYASNIRAVDQVDVRRPGTFFTCNRVAVELNPPSKTKPLAAAKPAPDSEASGAQPLSPKDRFAEVRSIFAIGDVRAKLDHNKRRVDLTADEMLADVERDRLTLTSKSAEQPAELFDLIRQQKITGQLIVMDDQAEALNITGPGSLATRLSDPNNPKAGIEDAFLAINWTKAMSFSNVTGKANFYENVRSESRRSTDASELNCDQLAMQFSPDYKRDPVRLIEDEGEDNHERQVRSAVATGNVKFTASAWNPLKPEDIRNRTLLEGPKLIFTNKPATAVGQTPTETLQVVGKGHMLLEDYRPPDKENKDRVFVTGRGATLFTWEDGMLLNARSNTATLTKKVQMVHRPKDDKGNVSDVVTLNGDKLVADLTDTGGLSVWLADDAPNAQISTINVDGNVRLKNTGRAMTGDHLEYLAKTNKVTVWTDEDKDVILEDLARDASTRTNKVVWDLLKNRIEIDQLRGGVAPLD